MENLVFTPLSDEEIENLGLSISDLWMLQAQNQEVQGPFSTNYLIAKSKEHEEFFENCNVYNLVIEEWKDFFSSAEFQRRQPKLVPAQNLIQNDDFYILVKGQKSGPFSLDQIKEKLQTNEIQISCEVSVDETKTWIKLFEHHHFDRRLFKNQEDLPFQPEQDVFNESDKITSIDVARAQKKRDDDTAITGLAFIGRGNDKGQTLKKDDQAEEVNNEASSDHFEEHPSQSDIIEFKLPKSDLTRKIEQIKNNIQWKYVAGFFIFFVVSFSAFNTFNNKFSSNADKIVKEVVETKKKNIVNSDRAIATKQPAQTTPRIQAKKPVKRYVPHQTSKSNSHNNTAKRNSNRNAHSRKKISHSYDDFENIDIDDPRVREELSRELASDYGDEYPEERDDYVDDYEQNNRRDMIEPALEPAVGNYPDENGANQYPDENYDEGYDSGAAEPAYEEYSDYE